MKQLIALLLLSLALVGSGFTQDKPTGPFGFTKGMTREQVIQRVGKEAVKKNTSGQPDVLVVSTAPIPNHVFESYLLIISPTHGLLKLSAIGADVATGDTGSELMSQFDTVVAAISSKYGAGTRRRCDWHDWLSSSLCVLSPTAPDGAVVGAYRQSMPDFVSHVDGNGLTKEVLRLKAERRGLTRVDGAIR